MRKIAVATWRRSLCLSTPENGDRIFETGKRERRHLSLDRRPDPPCDLGVGERQVERRLGSPCLAIAGAVRGKTALSSGSCGVLFGQFEMYLSVASLVGRTRT
jgi:hypothetical protein